MRATAGHHGPSPNDEAQGLHRPGHPSCAATARQPRPAFRVGRRSGQTPPTGPRRAGMPREAATGLVARGLSVVCPAVPSERAGSSRRCLALTDRAMGRSGRAPPRAQGLSRAGSALRAWSARTAVGPACPPVVIGTVCGVVVVALPPPPGTTGGIAPPVPFGGVGSSPADCVGGIGSGSQFRGAGCTGSGASQSDFVMALLMPTMACGSGRARQFAPYSTPASAGDPER